jgi:hypothetical protein
VFVYVSFARVCRNAVQLTVPGVWRNECKAITNEDCVYSLTHAVRLIAYTFFYEKQGGLGLGLHFPGFPQESDWTKALGVFATEQPVWFGVILTFICIAEGESVGHSGDNFRGKSTKTEAGNLNFDYLGLKKKYSADKYARYQDVEIKNGRAAMIAMASLFAMKAIPGSVPIMDVLGAQ